MLSKAERLRKSSVFQRAYSAKNSVGSSCLTLYVLHRKPARPRGKQILLPMVGFAISKKMLKSACKRNRAKRRAREAYRLTRQAQIARDADDYSLFRFYSLIFVINPSILTLDFPQVRKAMDDCLSKAAKKFAASR